MTNPRMSVGGKPHPVAIPAKTIFRHSVNPPVVISDDEMEHDSPDNTPATPENCPFNADPLADADLSNFPLTAEQLATASTANLSLEADFVIPDASSNDPSNTIRSAPVPTKRGGDPITHADSAILDPSVARGLIITLCILRSGKVMIDIQSVAE
ncbi:hypothetical protein MKX01_001994 [Papaver californicum]|nr:hypothetical protein MKX01_001994 [Papaver californicum]